ncbi:MAG: aminotransferase class III-fold pyridoxal phosphate-dependent enzyme, partial [Chloroflexi bacterium]|nr:aminotransferase class III-fold pyridoxal phosphate-dependent enzyme [Chloroflexota bacterium]
MSRDHVLYRDYTKRYPTITHGQGVYLYDDTGKRYIDACGGAVVVNVGHGRGEVAEAVAAQAKAVGYISSQRARTQIQIDLSERIAKHAPGDLSNVFFVSSGSEASESALKLARHHSLDKGRTEAYKVVSRWQSYHGNTIGAMSLGGRTGGRIRYTPLLIDFPHVVPPYCYRCPFGLTYPSCDLACARDLERTIRQTGANSITAFIAEPVIGATLGAAVPPDGYYQLVREICDKYDILFIADEVMAGMGRTGAWFSIEHWGVLPDIICFGKGISSGYTPLSGIIVSDRIVDLLIQKGGRFGHGHTHTANPVALAAGIAVLDILEREKLVERARTQGAYLMEKLQQLRERKHVGDVRGKGL